MIEELKTYRWRKIVGSWSAGLQKTEKSHASNARARDQTGVFKMFRWKIIDVWVPADIVKQSPRSQQQNEQLD